MSKWSYVPLEQVAKIDRAGIPPDQIVDGTLYIGLEHIESGGRILASNPVSNGDLASTKFHFTPKHILYGKLRPYLAKIALPEYEGDCSKYMLPILHSDKLDRSYLAYYLRQPEMVNYAASRSEGANLPRLSPKALAEFEIPLPPLEEQKRIAAILDQADALRRLRQRSIERLNSLGQAIFYEMFGECEDLPAEQLQNIAKIDRLGISPEKIANATNYIGLEHIEAGGKILKSVMVTNGDLASTKFQFTPHHVLYGKLRPYLAKIALPNIEGVCSTDILPILPSQRLNRTYLAYYLRLPKMVEYATSRSEGANLPRLSPKALAEFLIPLPSLDNQLSFETKIQEIERQKTQMLDQLVHTDNLFLALQHQAFNGELSGNVYVEHHALRKEASV